MRNRRLHLCVAMCALAVTQLSCRKQEVALFGPEFDQQLGDAIEQAVREPWTDVEFQFLELAMKSMVRQVEEQEQHGPCVIRLAEVCFTHPREQFPPDRPDGVWMMDMKNLIPPDKRFLREPVGKEIRQGQSENTVLQVSVFARHRGDAQALVGELQAVGEQVTDVGGQAQYGLFTVGINGKYDEQSGEWTITSDSITPVGALEDRSARSEDLADN